MFARTRRFSTPALIALVSLLAAPFAQAQLLEMNKKAAAASSRTRIVKVHAGETQTLNVNGTKIVITGLTGDQTTDEIIEEIQNTDQKILYKRLVAGRIGSGDCVAKYESTTLMEIQMFTYRLNSTTSVGFKVHDQIGADSYRANSGHARESGFLLKDKNYFKADLIKFFKNGTCT